MILRHFRQVISFDSAQGPIELVPQGMEFNRNDITAEHVLGKSTHCAMRMRRVDNESHEYPARIDVVLIVAIGNPRE